MDWIGPLIDSASLLPDDAAIVRLALGRGAGKAVSKDGVSMWAPMVEFTTKEARDRFQVEALKVIDELLAGGGR